MTALRPNIGHPGYLVLVLKAAVPLGCGRVSALGSLAATRLRFAPTSRFGFDTGCCSPPFLAERPKSG